MVRYVLDGIAHGFPSGFDSSLVSLRSSHRNMKSALQHPDVIDKYLANKISHGRVVGPFASPPFPNLQCSPFGVIPKKGQPGKWRLILDLSSPEGHSVNDGIPRDPFSLTYISVDHAIARLVQLGPGALIAKFDVECAYRNIALRPDERFLFGMWWRESYFVDLALPLVCVPPHLSSTPSPKWWKLLKANYRVRFLLHYLDDFLTLGPGNSSECASNVAIARSLFLRLGLPLHPSKCEGPTTTLVFFLGVELNSLTQSARLPSAKFVAIVELLQKMES
ncbi:uncharacterized protein LOC114532033 [Dendronephthya gigantea]|uniref:uncharacterized protein LOC114532033 n=1 Tax=Dendronephthya gigantea TaxID=151771 RepID=UPI00106D31C1|nr:uncharacterized protein LOC114532033 [Dendronephthya gigantea]